MNTAIMAICVAVVSVCWAVEFYRARKWQRIAAVNAGAIEQAKAIARERDDLLGKLSDADAARVARSREWPEILTYE